MVAWIHQARACVPCAASVWTAFDSFHWQNLFLENSIQRTTCIYYDVKNKPRTLVIHQSENQSAVYRNAYKSSALIRTGRAAVRATLVPLYSTYFVLFKRFLPSLLERATPRPHRYELLHAPRPHNYIADRRHLTSLPKWPKWKLKPTMKF